jgi:hypothetical protein
LGCVANLLTGPVLAACALLLVAGVGKLRDPQRMVPALRALGLPARPRAVRLLGVLEIAAALAGLCIGPAAVVVALFYGALALVAWNLHRRAPAVPCGCLGGEATPVSTGHVALNVVATLVAIGSISTTSPLARMGNQPGAAIVLLVLSLLIARLAVLAANVQEASV